VRKNLRFLALGLLAVGATACGDRTVTSAPAQTSAPSVPAATDRAARGATVEVDESDLNSVDDLLHDIEADLRSVDHDIATPEGDPSE
jgi:hypothetical protein